MKFPSKFNQIRLDFFGLVRDNHSERVNEVWIPGKSRRHIVPQGVHLVTKYPECVAKSK